MTESESRALKIGADITYCGTKRLLAFVEQIDVRYVWVRYENGLKGLLPHDQMGEFEIGWHACPEGAI